LSTIFNPPGQVIILIYEFLVDLLRRNEALLLHEAIDFVPESDEYIVRID